MVDVDLERFNHIRLRVVPQGGRASEESRDANQKKKKKTRSAEGKLGWGLSRSLSSSPLGNFALSSPAEP